MYVQCTGILNEYNYTDITETVQIVHPFHHRYLINKIDQNITKNIYIVYITSPTV